MFEQTQIQEFKEVKSLFTPRFIKVFISRVCRFNPGVHAYRPEPGRLHRQRGSQGHIRLSGFVAVITGNLSEQVFVLDVMWTGVLSPQVNWM